MRVALIHGPIEGNFPPLGVLTLAAIAKSKGVPVIHAELPLTEAALALAHDLSGFDLVGISTDSSSYPYALLFARALRNADPSARVVLGGPQATVTAAETVAAFPEIDLVIKGEAETSWPILLDRIAGQAPDWRDVPGGVWRDGDDTKSIPENPVLADVDDVPLPDYAALPWVHQLTSIPLEVGRGCPYGCTFCSTNTFFKRRFRMKSTARIVRDVKDLVHLFGVDHVDFVHDMFTVRRDFVVDICKAMRALSITWNCSARTDRLDVELLQLMIEAGCTGIYAGLETGSQRLQPLIQKNLVLTEAMAMVRQCQLMGLSVTTSLIMGYPNETREDLFDTLLCVLELSRGHPSGHARGRIQPQLHLFSPLAGTPIMAESQKYVFDGTVSNLAELGNGEALPEDVSDLITAYPDIFSAFYRPDDTEVSRHHYFAISRFMTHIMSDTRVLATVGALPARDFVGFLVEPGFERFLRPSPSATFEAVMEGYLNRPRVFGKALAPGVFTPTPVSARL